MLRERIELSTSPLPRECSTTELPQPPMAGLLPYRTGKRKAKREYVWKPAPDGFPGHGGATMLAMPDCWVGWSPAGTGP
ncbi:hypothetical protein MESS2_760133 [Mesorhizobium metallidurans STM 2683]|uniref:Uncharacterized protein n=1 Tax=Mesorhizobium metallidurans STM 2683 TaxID=1297569 RepID=M5F9L4_9HYPH|nr:hypothetical protein MESS2_760133 [Mesorhizobium metallidurans STM 2683]